jgi:hypothetical protein
MYSNTSCSSGVGSPELYRIEAARAIGAKIIRGSKIVEIARTRTASEANRVRLM